MIAKFYRKNWKGSRGTQQEVLEKIADNTTVIADRLGNIFSVLSRIEMNTDCACSQLQEIKGILRNQYPEPVYVFSSNGNSTINVVLTTQVPDAAIAITSLKDDVEQQWVLTTPLPEWLLAVNTYGFLQLHRNTAITQHEPTSAQLVLTQSDSGKTVTVNVDFVPSTYFSLRNAGKVGYADFSAEGGNYIYELDSYIDGTPAQFTLLNAIPAWLQVLHEGTTITVITSQTDESHFIELTFKQYESSEIVTIYVNQASPEAPAKDPCFISLWTEIIDTKDGRVHITSQFVPLHNLTVTWIDTVGIVHTDVLPFGQQSLSVFLPGYQGGECKILDVSPPEDEAYSYYW